MLAAGVDVSLFPVAFLLLSSGFKAQDKLVCISTGLGTKVKVEVEVRLANPLNPKQVLLTYFRVLGFILKRYQN